VVIVLYKTDVKSSKTYTSFIKHIQQFKHNYNLLIYNNSKEISITSSEHYIVVNAGNNNKLTGAYNFALDYANEHQSEWLLLLDSDSTLTDEYFIELSNILNSDIQNDIVSIVPNLVQNNRIISPHMNRFMHLRRSAIKKSGINSGKITAFNSLSFIRVAFLNEINGFSPDYPLDMLDFWVYHQIYKRNKLIFLLDSKIEHDLSVLNFEENMTIDRYVELILAEKKFFNELGFGYKYVYRFRLLLRAIKQCLIFENKEFSKITLKHLFK
jgi:hypothetical protein